MKVDLSSVSRSIAIKDERGRTMRFPSRADYLEHLISVGAISSSDELANQPDLATDVYLDWLRRGQIGCVFGQLFGRKRFRGNVITEVLAGRTDTPEGAQALATAIDHVFKAAVGNPEAEALTILLPSVNTMEDLVRLLAALPSVPGWKLESVIDWGATLKNIGVRAEVSPGTWAEVLGVGPFPMSVPSTRLAPMTALEIRPKPDKAKFSKIHPRELLSAHLDKVNVEHIMHPQENPHRFDQLFKIFTPRLRVRILGGHGEDRRAKAGVTFTVPAAVWNLLGDSGPKRFVESD